MMNTAIASIALFGTSALAGAYGYSATAVGSAQVINQCNYPVKLCSVPSSGGGQEQEDKILAAGESWSQPWTELTNGNGWSIKLSKTDNLDHILQYEYTFHNDGIIWYDLSCVDGNPWDYDWQITANGSDCSPKQQAYRYSTDDAYGMQSCSQDTDITVTLCTGTSVDDGSAVNSPSNNTTGSAAPSYSAPANTTAPAAPSSYEAPSSSSTPAPQYTPTGYNPPNEDTSSTTENAPVTPTTFLTSATTQATSTDDSGVVIITDFVTVWTTAEATAYPNRLRRHEHGHGGTHQHNA